MFSFAFAFEQVKKLAQDFKEHEFTYLAPEYSEAQVRKLIDGRKIVCHI
jgi:hypothetical protein